MRTPNLRALKALLPITSAIVLMTAPAAQAVPICREVLRTPISSQERMATLDALAEMKLQLDIESAAGNKSILHNQTRAQFQEKILDFQKALNLSIKEATDLVKEKITEKQNDKNHERKKESKKRHALKEVLKNIPTYKLARSFETPHLSDGVLSPNAKFLYVTTSSPNRILSLNLESGVKTFFDYDSRLEMQDSMLLRIKDQWFDLNLDTSTISNLNTGLTTDTFRKLTVSIDKKNILDFSERLQDPESGVLNIEIRDSHAMILSRREIPFELPVTEIPYFSDKYLLIVSGQKVFKYEIQTELVTELNVGTGIFTPVIGTDKVVIREDAHKVSLLDIDSGHFERRHFDKIAEAFYASPELIMIAERDSSSRVHFHMIKPSDFSKSDESFPDRSNFVVNDIAGTDYISIFNEHLASNEPPAIFHKRDFSAPVFEFDHVYNDPFVSKVHRQWISQDGNLIVATIYKSRGQPEVHVWERQNGTNN
jgi:hypothetical protein